MKIDLEMDACYTQLFVLKVQMKFCSALKLKFDPLASAKFNDYTTPSNSITTPSPPGSLLGIKGSCFCQAINRMEHATLIDKTM